MKAKQVLAMLLSASLISVSAAARPMMTLAAETEQYTVSGSVTEEQEKEDVKEEEPLDENKNVLDDDVSEENVQEIRMEGNDTEDTEPEKNENSEDADKEQNAGTGMAEDASSETQENAEETAETVEDVPAEAEESISEDARSEAEEGVPTETEAEKASRPDADKETEEAEETEDPETALFDERTAEMPASGNEAEKTDEEAAAAAEAQEEAVSSTEGVIADIPTASAYAEENNSETVTVFYVGNDYNGAVDHSNASTYTIEVPEGVENVRYEIVEGTSATVSAEGVVTPGTESGTVVVHVSGTDYSKDVVIDVKDYVDHLYEEVLRSVSEDIRNKESEMAAQYEEGRALKALEVLGVAEDYVRNNYNYDAGYSSGKAIVATGGGDCIANSMLVRDILKEAGIEAALRYSANYPGCGNNHYNVIAKYEGNYYVIEAGSTGTAPRYGSVTKENSGFYVTGGRVCQYDGFEEDVTVPDSKATILANPYNVNVFARNQAVKVKTVTIPSGIVEIDAGAFYAAGALERITVSEDNEHYKDIDGYLYTKDGRTLVKAPCAAETVVIDPGTKVIGKHALSTMSRTKEIIIPEGVEEIMEYAINAPAGCVEKIVIPRSVVSIGEDILWGSASGTTLYVYEGSYAEQYAKEKNLNYKLIEEPHTHSCENDGHVWNEGTVTKERSCTEDGIITYTCSECGASRSESVPAAGHSFNEWTTTKNPGCETAGEKKRSCTVCGTEETESIPAAGHTWNKETTTDKEPSCTENGNASIHCYVCGAVKAGSETEIPAKGHFYDEGTVMKEPACTEPGEKIFRCKTCGDSYKEEIPASGHQWSEWTVIKEATADEQGVEIRTCKNNSSHTEERSIPELGHIHSCETEGHIWDDGIIAKKASCTEEGTMTYTCTECGMQRSDPIQKIGHVWEEDYTTDMAPSCTENGSASIHCSVCGAVKAGSETEIPAAGHIYNEGYLTKDPTCTGSGEKTFSCTVCGDTYTEEIPAVGHAWNTEYTIDKAPSCVKEGTESIHCTRCGEVKGDSERVIAAAGHLYGEWKIVKEPSCAETGIRKKTCISCGNEIAEAVPAAGHKPAGSYTVDRESTFTARGIRSLHCTICKKPVPGTEQALELKKGWNTNGAVRMYYYGNGTFAKNGIIEINGKKYCFDKNGAVLTGYRVINGKTYYFGADGAMQTGWKNSKDARYYFDPKSGEAAAGWKTVGGKKYYFSSAGKMLSGWKSINGKLYYFMDSRYKAYTPAAQGSMLTGFKTIGGKTFYFIDSRASTANSSNWGSAANGAVKMSGKNILYFENGIQKKKTGWVNYGGKRYYFASDGKAKKGWQKISGKWYYMDGNGVMKTGWVKDGEKWYFMNSNGSMRTGWLKTGGKMYFLNADGSRKTGWKNVKNRWYHFRPDGSMNTGLTKLGNTYYYFYSGGTMAAGRTVTVGGVKYYADDDGHLTLKK